MSALADRRADHLRHALGPLASGLLAEKDVTDVYLNPPEKAGGPGEIMVVRHGADPEPVGTMTAPEAMRLITAVAGVLDTYVNKEHPALEGELFGDGPRFQGLIPPLVLGPAWAIRNPAAKAWTLAEYLERGDVTPRQLALLEDAALNRLNVVFVGGTGSGKTSMLNAFGGAVARLTPEHRIASIEQARELRLASRNKVQIRVAPGFDEQAALRAVLRLNIDRIWMGEMRGAEVLPWLFALNTGHAGGAGTLHSDTVTPEDALDRIEDMCSLATAAPQQRKIGRLINLIVCLVKDRNGKRRVSQMVRVLGWDGTEYQLQEES